MEKGWSQQRLADAIGTSKVTVSDLELGKMQLTLDYMRRISGALGCAAPDLLAIEDNPYALSLQERAMIDRMRAADPSQLEQLDRVADVVAPYRPDDAKRAG
jgi:transcriptional regulator with XRE-family HTH domain